MYTAFREEAGMVPRHIFEEFVAFAGDSDLEDVLTLQTKLYRCAHIFLGECMFICHWLHADVSQANVFPPPPDGRTTCCALPTD